MSSNSSVFMKVGEIKSMISNMMESSDFLSNDVSVGLLSQMLKDQAKRMEKFLNENPASK